MNEAGYRKTKTNWARPSLNPMQNRGVSADYRPRAPWEEDSGEVMDDFSRALNALDTNVKAPWEEGSVDFIARQKQLEAASNYKYESLFEEPSMSEERKKQLEAYKYNPPFNCGYNQQEEVKPSAKKLNPDKNVRTREPWSYGSMPADPAPIKVHPRPATSLWEVPRGDQSASINAMASSGDPVLDSLRAQLKSHGASGIAGLAKKFRIMDDDDSGTLNLDEFRKGVKECGLVELSDKAIRHLFRYFDRDDSGLLTYDEFLVGIRGVMNERRKSMVHMAFRILDTDGSGEINSLDLKGVYNASSHPDVVQGKKTEKEILAQFLATFEVGKEKDGIVTLKEFEDYYSTISASIDSDDYFELMIRNAWHISGGEGFCANTTNRRILVTHADGRQSVEEVKNDINISKKNTNAMLASLKAQGLNVANINLTDTDDMAHQIENPEYIKNRHLSSETLETGPVKPVALSAFANNTNPQLQRSVNRPSGRVLTK